MINPYQNRATTNRNIAMAESVMRFTATVTTSLGSFIWGRSTALQYLPEGWFGATWIAFIVGLIAAVISAWLTDLMFGQLLQRVCYDLMASRHPNVVKWSSGGGPGGYFKAMRGAERMGFIVVLAGLLVFDAYTTLIIRDPVADQARQQTTVDVEGVRSKIQVESDQRVAALRADAKSKAKEISEAERGVVAANPALVRLKSEGNAWAASELAKKVKKATAPVHKQKADIEAQITATMSTDATYIQSRVSEADAANARANDATQRNRAVFSGMYLAFTVIPKLLSIILRILMVVSFLAYSHNFNPDLTGDGIIDYHDVEEYHRREKEAAAQRQAAHQQRSPGGGPGPAFR